MMKTVLLLLLIASSSLVRAEQYNMAEHFSNPAKMPAPITADLFKKLSSEQKAACEATKPDDLYEAELVALNKTSKAYVVKPASQCLCVEGHCPVWLYQLKGKVVQLVWSAPAIKEVEVQDKTLNGYRKVRAVAADEVKGHESLWSWDRHNYTEIYKNVWTWDAEKQCRLGEETTQLMDGRMIEHTIKCVQK